MHHNFIFTLQRDWSKTTTYMWAELKIDFQNTFRSLIPHSFQFIWENYATNPINKLRICFHPNSFTSFCNRTFCCETFRFDFIELKLTIISKTIVLKACFHRAAFIGIVLNRQNITTKLFILISFQVSLNGTWRKSWERFD